MKYNTIKKREITHFIIGGGSAVLIDFIIYKLLLLSSVDIFIAKSFSFFCGATVGFIINKLWTFQSSEFKKKEIRNYIILYLCSATINALINKVTILAMGIEIVAFLLATMVSTIINFLGQKYFVFEK